MILCRQAPQCAWTMGAVRLEPNFTNLFCAESVLHCSAVDTAKPFSSPLQKSPGSADLSGILLVPDRRTLCGKQSMAHTNNFGGAAVPLCA